MFLLIWLRPVKYPFKNNRGQAQQRLVSPQCIHNDQSLLACLCLTVSQLLFSHSMLIETVYYPTSTSWLFQQVLKMLPCGVVKKLIWLICGDCSSGGEEGPGAICGSAVCLVGCDEWVERMLICAWKASQLLTCWGSTPAADTGRHLSPGCCLVKWRWWWCQAQEALPLRHSLVATNWPQFNLTLLLVHETMNQQRIWTCARSNNFIS